MPLGASAVDYKERGRLMLSRDTEIDLVLRAQAGDRHAADLVIRAHEPLVNRFVKRWAARGQWHMQDDLRAEGHLGLLRALQTFDPTRGFRFATYAVWWVRIRVQQCAMHDSRVVSRTLTRQGRAIFHRLPAAERDIRMRGAEPTASALAAELRLEEGEVADVLASREGETRLDDYEDSAGPCGDDGVELDRLRQRVDSALAGLSEREQVVVRMRLLDETTLQAAGDAIGMTRESARLLEIKAKAKLRLALADLEDA